MSVIIDGKQLAQTKEGQLAQKVTAFKNKTGITPKLTCFLVGNNPASRIYLHLKQQAAKRVEIEMEIIEFSPSTNPPLAEIELTELIKEKNRDKQTHGIMVQLPLPEKLRVAGYELRVLEAIEPNKDVDGLTGRSKFLPAVVCAIIDIINFAKYPLVGSKIAIVGQGKLVGRPLAVYLKNLGAQVLIADINTPNLAEITKKAEILVTATGQPGLVKKEMVRPGALVIDVGSPKPEVDFEAVKNVAGVITPVPGGVGPLTVACLLENVLIAANYAIIKP
jgi:methylenetetrahydrofolate dehydrogenase (NADP+)/methenyltetrahydrofolate cyclohydrolase